MNKTAWVALLAVASVPAFGQATTDRNLKATRNRSDVTTAPPPRVHAGGQSDSAAQLDKLEHQTARIVAPPAAKTQKAPVYKTPADNQRPTGTAYQQTMPLHAAHPNGASASPRHSARPASPSPYGH